MGARQARAVPLTPPLSLNALGLTIHSSLDDAVRALLVTREELKSLQSSSVKGVATSATESEARQRRGTVGGGNIEEKAIAAKQDELCRPLPPKDRLVVCIAGRDAGAVGLRVLGGGSASKNGHRRLAELGVVSPAAAANDETDTPSGIPSVDEAPRLVLGETDVGRGLGVAAACARRIPRGICRCRRNRKRSGYCQRICLWLWSMLPPRCQERLQPYVAQARFYGLCASWALQWLWQDRHEIWREFKDVVADDLWASGGPPPRNAAKVWEELRPFGYALGAGALYGVWDVGRRALWQAGPSMEVGA